MGRGQDGVQLARLFYGTAAAIALVVAVGVVAPALMGDPGGCRVALSLGAPAAFVPAGGNPAPQFSPGPRLPGEPSTCTQYVDVALPLVALVLGAILILTAVRLGREPRSWGPSIAFGVIAGIAAAMFAAYAILAISSSDQPQSSPGLGLFLAAAAPVVVALAGALAVWRAYGRGATPGSS